MDQNKAAANLQADKFRDLARKLDCDEDETRFEATVKKVAKKPPVPEDESKT